MYYVLCHIVLAVTMYYVTMYHNIWKYYKLRIFTQNSLTT